MSNNTSELNVQDDGPSHLDQNNQLRRILFRVLPYSPLIVLAVLLGIAGSYTYLRYATPTYAAKARLIVNDDSQQKSANLLDIMQLDTRNLSAETEKEMGILSSRDLLSKLVTELQLNVQYSQKGYVKLNWRIRTPLK
jgi:tyrosine-protein kinase Etk/Wzc